MNAIPLSLYVHFPWCVEKCPYCDFNSHALASDLPASQYVDALIEDLAVEAGLEDRRTLNSIFMGGGTPSLFPPEEIARLLQKVAERFEINDIEITMEANPGTFDETNFQGYFDAGVNRLSIGAQSFSDDSLKALGRIHKADEIEAAFAGARQAGFKRINLDLMYGLPGQSTSDAMNDLQTAIDLGAEHISWYQLTIEPNTYFHRYPPVVPPEAQLEDTMRRGHQLLVENDYENYEVSAFARADEASRHNLNYWHFGDYLGIGAGAHGKQTRLPDIVRTSKTRVPSDYLINQKAIINRVPEDERLLEYLMNALRLTHGFTLSNFELTTGLSRDSLNEFVSIASARGLIQVDNDHVATTDSGRLYLNDLLLLAA